MPATSHSRDPRVRSAAPTHLGTIADLERQLDHLTSLLRALGFLPAGATTAAQRHLGDQLTRQGQVR